MSQRIFISCRSNHDQIVIANLACQTQLKRTFSPEDDFLRWAGTFDASKDQPTKCQILIDCAVKSHDGKTKIPLACYKALPGENKLVVLNPPADLYNRLDADYAWGTRGARTYA